MTNINNKEEFYEREFLKEMLVRKIMICFLNGLNLRINNITSDDTLGENCI